MIDALPKALHRGQTDLPFVNAEPGLQIQLLQADVESGVWVIRTRLQPGTTLQRHQHTGEVSAFTISGSWRYLEYPEVNIKGSYLFEPAESIHTLHVPDDAAEITDIWFAIRGANRNYDKDGNVDSVIDAAEALKIYYTLCREQGHNPPSVIGA